MSQCQSLPVAVAFLLMLFPHMAGAQKKPDIRFGLIADIQYGDCETANNRHYRASLQKTAYCVETLNREKVNFTLNLGDAIDRNPVDFASVWGMLDKLKTPLYNTAGNHDYGGIIHSDSLYRILKMPSAYYAFRYKKWKFIVLNTNCVSSYSDGSGVEYEKMLAGIKERKGKNGQPWNGGLGADQLAWLQKELDAAREAGLKVLIFSHHPFFPASGYTALDSEKLLELADHYDCIKACF